jgi:molybdenum cofactor biosynthesis enzyme MoaA
MESSYDFANILFAGPCNLRCPYCIGRQVDSALNRNNLRTFPLRNLERFAALIQYHQVTEVVLTGTTTDPQLYRHEARLLSWLRERLAGPVRYSLHTNGQLALRKMVVFNQYDRVCISFPSFKPDTYQKLMGSARVPNLAEIIQQAETPVKVSAVINEHNVHEVDEFLARCGAIGVKRLVFRRLYGDTREWPILWDLPQKSTYRNNPVYDYHGMEVTYWNFHTTGSTSLNLFSDGTISDRYLLTEAERR